jgi:V/A-type H+-transporting ATPase subunit C
MSTKYASAVAAVKAMETTLLTGSDIEQLINARTLKETEALLAAKKTPGSSLSDVWEMLRSSAPDSRELKILLYRNDFHNLKAVLKAKLSNRDPSVYYVEPSNVTLEDLDHGISSKDYSGLPEYLREPAEEAYELLTRTLDGQLSDSLIDAASLNAMQRDAADFGGSFMQRYAVLTTVCADIKTAYRCSIMKKSRSFLETAICGSPELDKESLIRAAQSGTDTLFRYLEDTAYSGAAELLKTSPAQFEKWCDDVIMEHAESARMQAFGPEPLAAYYIAKEAEIKDVRIIKVCKECGTDTETIMERMRKLYV